MFTQQLEDLLVKRRLEEEHDLMTETVHANTVTTKEKIAESAAVGPTVCLPMRIGGVEVEAFVDTGSRRCYTLSCKS